MVVEGGGEGERAVGVCRLYEADGLAWLAGYFCLFVLVTYTYISDGIMGGHMMARRGIMMEFMDGWRDGGMCPGGIGVRMRWDCGWGMEGRKKEEKKRVERRV